ncbi:hypothetical protein ACFLVP_02885 [Chloroflexota bacterium]
MESRKETKMQMLKQRFPNGKELLILGGPDKMVCLIREKGEQYEEVKPELLKSMIPDCAMGRDKGEWLHFMQVVQACLAR